MKRLSAFLAAAATGALGTAAAQAQSAALDGRWTGTASGKASGKATKCWPMRFDIVVRAGAITGQATMRMTSTEAQWTVSGAAKADGTVSFTAETQDRKVESRSMRWLGRLAADGLHLGQPAGRACNPGRSGILTKS